jgi:hypothetical protein
VLPNGAVGGEFAVQSESESLRPSGLWSLRFPMLRSGQPTLKVPVLILKLTSHFLTLLVSHAV